MSDLYNIWLISKRFLIDCQGISYADFTKMWIHRCIENPFKKSDVSIGFVIESQISQVVGFMGEIPLKLRMFDKNIPISAISSWVVDPGYRNYSLLLFKAFLENNKDCFIFATSSNIAASNVYKNIGEFDKNPDPDYEKRLIWWINPKKVLKHKIKEKNIFFKTLKKEPFLTVISCFVRLRNAISRNKILPNNTKMNVERIQRFDKEIDNFLEEYKKKFGIFHYRTSQFLNWRHIDIPETKGKSYAFVYREDKCNIKGYLVIRHVPPPEGFPGYYIVTDVMYDPGKQKILSNLISAAYDFARNNDGSLFEVSGFNQITMNHLLRFNPQIIKSTHCIYWYKAPNTELANICKREDWWSSGIDGDLNI